jgi:DNA replication protein DnaC
MTQAFAELEASGEGATLTHADWLGLLVDREITHRRDKRLAARLRYARLRHNAVVEDIDYRAPRGLDRALFHKLADGEWIDAHDNLILCGTTGVGKSWLACALGHKACRDNRSVLYQRVPKLFADLALARGDGRYARIMRSLNGAQLLILDDWGLDPLDAGARRDLYEILEERYGRRSTILTSQVPIDKWHEVIGDPTYADAILDRLVHNAHRTAGCWSILHGRSRSGSSQAVAGEIAYRSKTNRQQDALKRATSCRNSERHDLGMTERHRRNPQR